MVINSLVIYHFVDPDLGIDIFFGNEDATE